MQGYGKEDSFELPVVYRGQELLLPGRLVQMGYTYKIYIAVEGQEIIFEPDEERNLRVVVATETARMRLSTKMIREIGEALQRELR